VRKVMSVFALVGAVASSAGCASSAASPSAAPAAGTSAAAPVATAPSGSTDAISPSATSGAPSAVSTPAAKPPTAKPSSAHATTSAAKPTPGAAPTSFGYSRTANAQAQIDAARAAAKADGKEVLLDFGATWCGNCVAMDADFRTSQVQAVLAASYHLVQIDVDVSANMSILAQYDNSGGYGLPTLIVLSPTGTIRVDTNKSGNPGFDKASFLAFLKKWAA
jgi:thiol:disulfide interchange protein